MIQIKNAFSKGMKRWRGMNAIPPFYAWYMRNCRIDDGMVKNKIGADYAVTSTDTKHIQALLYYRLENTWLAIANGKLYKWVTSSPWTLVGLCWWYTDKDEYNMFTHGDFVLILSWQTHIYVYHQVYWLYQSSDPLGFNSWTWVLPPALNDWVSSLVEAYPRIWCAITWFTLIAWNSSVARKVLYISKPVTPTAPWNCYNFSTATTKYDIWENRYMNSIILALIPVQDNVYVFCENEIELIGRWTAQDTGSVVTLATQKIGSTDQIMNRRCWVAVGEKCFFFTKSKRAMAINYQPWIEFPTIAPISDDIQDWLDQNIGDDQANRLATAYYDRDEEHVEFHLVKEWGDSNTVPNVVLIYDLKSQSRSIDDDIAFQHLARGATNYSQTYWANGAHLYRDGYGESARGNRWQDATNTIYAINAQYNTPNIWLWTTEEKLFKWVIVRGGINAYCEITVDVYIDGILECTKSITSANIPTAEKSVIETWDPETYSNNEKIYPFELVLDQWMVRKKGKRIRIRITAKSSNDGEPGLDPYANRFYLDELRIDAVSTGNYELSDKF